MNYFLSFFLLLSIFSQAQHTFTDTIYDTDTESSLKITSPFSGVPPRGYYPLSIEIENLSDLPVQWNFKVSSHDGYMYSIDRSNRLSSDYSFTCPPKEVGRYKLLVPLVTVLDYDRYQNNANISINARGVGIREQFQPRLETSIHRTMPSVMMSERLHRQNGSSLSSEFTTMIAKKSGKKMDFATYFLPTDMTPDWRAYTGFDVIMCSPEDWGEMNASVQRALLEWLRMGGELVVFQHGKEVSLESLGIPSVGAHGWGTVSRREMEKSYKVKSKPFINFIKGREKANMDLINNYQSNWPLKKDFGVRRSNLAVLIIILLIFAILVGPVNLFIFAKEGRRHRLFFTTPIISLATTLLLFIVIYVKDGVGGNGSSLSLVEIDSKNKALIGAQEQICRTGMLLKSRFTLDTPATIDPLVLHRDNFWARVRKGNTGGKCSYRAELTTPSQTSFEGDWYLSRTETAHLIHYKKPFRQGIEIMEREGAYYALSSLDTPLEVLFYISPDGKYLSAENLKQGKEVKLKESTAPLFNTWVSGQQNAFGKKNKTRLRNLAKEKGRYFTSCKKWNHLETLSSIDWNQKKALISGEID